MVEISEDTKRRIEEQFATMTTADWDRVRADIWEKIVADSHPVDCLPSYYSGNMLLFPQLRNW